MARGYFGRVTQARLKADRSEVCEADEAAQVAVVAALRGQRPDDAFVTEEVLRLAAGPPAPPPASDDVVCWVVDPLDGTRNFLRGIPLYACSVAAMRGGWPICGAIYDPAHDVLYSGTCAEGLFVNGRPHSPLRLSGANPKPIVGVPSSPSGATAALAHQWLDRFVCRGLGCTALQLAWVASGELDASLSDNARLWDLAAGWVLVAAAGGRLTSPAGASLFPLDVQRYAGEELPNLAARAGFLE
jgi:myo-inositol-1(or 4)-monophosphatase